MGTKISLGSVDVSFFNALIINDLYIEDLHHDTLLYAAQLSVDIGDFSFQEKKIVLDKIELTNTLFNLKKYKTEKSTNLSFIIDHFASNDSTKSQWDFAMNTIVLNDTRFNYNDEHFAKIDSGVDYKHIAIANLDLITQNINLVDKGIDCEIEKLNFMEQSGFQVDEFTADVNVLPTGITTEYLHIKTPFSKVDGNLAFVTQTYKDWSNFIDTVSMRSNFNKTTVSFKDIAHFAPALNGLEKSLNFEGEIGGTVGNLKGRKLAILLDDGTRFNGDADISGLPNPADMFMYLKVNDLITTKAKLETIPLYPFTKGTYIELPNNFRHLGAVRFKGSFTGFYHDFVTYGTLKTSLGNLKTDLSLKLNQGTAKYRGELASNKFDLGKFLNMKKDIGEIAMDVKIDGEGFSKKNVNANLTGDVKRIIIKDYEYNNVELTGNFKDQIFSGYAAVKDENVSFDFDGDIDLSKEIPTINFVSNIVDAKLAKLNFVSSKEKLKTRFSTQLKVNLAGRSIDDLAGNVVFNNSRYIDELDDIVVENVLVTSNFIGENRTLVVRSDLLDAEMEGKFRFKEIVNYAQQFFARYIPSQIDETHSITNLSNDLSFNVELHNSELLSKVLFKGIKMSDHSIIYGEYDAEKHNLSVVGKSPLIDAYGTQIHQFSFDGQANENYLNIIIDAVKIYQNDSLYLDNFNLLSVIEKDSILTSINWKNKGDVSRNEASITIASVFEGYRHASNRFIDSYAYVADSLWRIKPYNEIVNDTGSLFIKGLTIYSETQSILFDGRLSNKANDQLDILFRKLNLLTFKRLIPEKVISLEGIIDGVASIKKKDGAFIFTSDLNFDQFRVNENLIGKGNLLSSWNPLDESLKLEGKFYRDHIPTILFGGYYFPNKESESLAMNFELYQTELNMFDGYTNEFLKDLDGKANAKVALTGSFKEPRLNGDLTLQNTSFKVVYLNTAYRSNLCKINIAPDIISFDNVEFFDENNNVAKANGTIYHQWFTEWSIGLGLDVNNFLALNTSEKDNNLYYGKAYVSGSIDLASYDKLLTLDIKVKTEENTTLNIPLTDNEDLVANNFIEFISNDSAEITVEEKLDLSNVEMNFDLEITPEAQLRLVFDDQIGDVMRSTGSGNLKMKIGTDGDLEMFGNYVITDGDYLFTLQNVINKRFDLEEGGTITWSGSPYDADINITAVYRLRARLYDLLANVDTNDIYKKRIPVDLKLHMRNSMMNPDIDFDIVLPTADEETKSKVRSVLYVSDKEENVQELNKQVFSLLVLRSFLPPPGAGSTYGRASASSTNSFELLSNQLSNIFSRISNDFDIGVNYIPGDDLSNQEVELALSTQLFNDRLVLDGNFGYSDRENVSNEAQGTNNLIGDISVEYKITKDGKLRVKAFNNSSQFSLVETNNAYTQGLGLSYKEEYDTSKEFWNNLFNRFKKKTKNTKAQ